MKAHKCSGCRFWVWHPKDRLYDTPGFHQCSEPDLCERFKKMKIKRDAHGYITDECLTDMRNSLPIEVFASFDNTPHRVLNSPAELEKYLFGALPYALTTYYRKKED